MGQATRVTTAMIMAAGVGSRLEPLTLQVPKPMVPVANRPAMERILMLARSHGITEVVANVHYLADTITDYFGDGSRLGMRIDYSHEPQLLGTAGGVRAVRHRFQSTFVVLSGDGLTDLDITALVEAHRQAGAVATMAVSRVRDPWRFGVVVAEGAGATSARRVIGFQEKPTRGTEMSDLVNTGIYVLEPEAFDFVPDIAAPDFGRDVFPAMLAAGAGLYAWKTDAYWCDIGTLTHYRLSHMDLLEGRATIRRSPDEVVRCGGGVEMGADVEVRPGAHIEPPVILGDRCSIEDGATVRRSVVGPGCRIRAGATVRDSVVWANTLVEQGAVLDSCVVGSRCYLGKGSVLGQGVVLSDASVVEEFGQVKPNVRIGPRQRVKSRVGVW